MEAGRMFKTVTVLIFVLSVTVSLALATPQPQAIQATMAPLPMLDTFDDTLTYDDGQIALWYGGLSDFQLATRFTPLTDFEMQEILIAFMDGGPTPLDLYLKNDDNGIPGSTIYWSGTFTYYLATTWLPVLVDTTGMYTFAAQEDFWIEIHSAGPPHEMFDASPTIPQRSFFKAWGSTTWYNSPGDNFIRAAGEYASVPNDVGVDSVDHDENFFVTNGTSFSVNATVTNYSAIPAIFDVGCVIYTEITENTYVYFDSLAPQNAMLIPGQSSEITFPAYAWNTNDRYKIDVRTYWSEDSNPDNNVLAIETQVYETPAELRYDDDVPDGGVTSSTVDFGWGMKFDPHQSGEYTIASIQVYTSTGDSAARVQVLNDLGYAPGLVLWEEVAVMESGWNEFTVDVTNSDAFFIFYLFEHGASSPALWRDGYPTSGQGWQKSGVIYTPDPTAEDWAMRPTISGGTSYPSWDIDVWHVSGSPIPASGDTLFWGVLAENTSGQVLNGDVWVDAVYNGTTTIQILSRPLTNYQPGWTIDRPDVWYNVSEGWPGGNYQWFVRTGVLPSVTWEEGYFDWSKSGPVDLDYDFEANMPLNAPDFFGDLTMTQVDYSVPTEYAVMGTYPNPFNPTTNISFALPLDAKVLLSVYDVSGRLVTTLVDGYRNAGIHDVTFDASDLASGIYLYRLEAGEFNVTGKMVLMK
ncbi:hypothetical protein CEE37_14735 [candidate division LCP-89 bacterium B3_LCP]|uniref:Secretion system C-terminal sorting domain-containing protein n=2 Tax=candidate division LCP-89 bacterium B3_LCP TaxID=2012998 RepID=A0A532UPI5_UNCL8|nr:MAG: hypothetical protein CEE37_14735 [candidate division LCP-89 bacterium B3_LCP]